ncbi:hypothetical protein Lsan_2701 [Legionella santicrucis]|uniref:Ankyrin repeat protein n=1 Tax=Legionella santicrucis TaxID=45074 RepID=A0A0W0YHW5_9GAMM|nr:hypothetical protein [Legionella santicrucis]KTD56541.1 hypothetical protein Lsan_2701 [Legionella santicrucis]
MKFSNEEDRRNHFQARFIPELVWSKLFKDKEVPDYILSWMSIPNEELKEKLFFIGSNWLTHKEDVERKKAWLAIAFSHPTLENQQLIEAGGQLGVHTETMLDLTFMLGDSPKILELMDLLKKDHQRKTIRILTEWKPPFNLVILTL